MTKFAPSDGLPDLGPTADDPPMGLCTRLVNCAKDAIILQNMQGHILWANQSAEAMFGWPLDELRGKSGLSCATSDGSNPNFLYDLESSIFDTFVVARHARRDGSKFWNQQSFAIVAPLMPGQDPMILLTCRDITEQVDTETALRNAKLEMQHAAFHDDLTGLPNRKRLKSFLQSKAVCQALKQHQIGVLQLDLDEFKAINDSLGHAVGDQTLVHVSEALERTSGPSDLPCRSGGDEFLLICTKIASQEALLSRAELILAELRKPINLADRALQIKASIGASLASPETETGEALIHQADQALYAAKASGRAQVVLYTPVLGQIQTTKTQLSRDIQEAVSKNQFSIRLQPQMNLATQRVTGCEALLRWDHPDFGVLSPADFLDIARQAGVLAELDYNAMNLALDALAELRKAGFKDLRLSLNVSAEIISDVNYPGLLDWALQSRGLHACDICIEILETTILQSNDFSVTTTVDKLKRLGACVALDDFGTGYAGLAHLSTIDTDEIKLDRSMIARLDHDPRTREIVAAIIHLSHRLGMTVVAEGVETQMQMDILEQAKCPTIQGYSLARPMTLDAFFSWLRSGDYTPKPFGRPSQRPKT